MKSLCLLTLICLGLFGPKAIEQTAQDAANHERMEW